MFWGDKRIVSTNRKKEKGKKTTTRGQGTSSRNKTIDFPRSRKKTRSPSWRKKKSTQQSNGSKTEFIRREKARNQQNNHNRTEQTKKIQTENKKMVREKIFFTSSPVKRNQINTFFLKRIGKMKKVPFIFNKSLYDECFYFRGDNKRF